MLRDKWGLEKWQLCWWWVLVAPHLEVIFVLYSEKGSETKGQQDRPSSSRLVRYSLSWQAPWCIRGECKWNHSRGDMIIWAVIKLFISSQIIYSLIEKIGAIMSHILLIISYRPFFLMTATGGHWRHLYLYIYRHTEALIQRYFVLVICLICRTYSAVVFFWEILCLLGIPIRKFVEITKMTNHMADVT